MKRNVAGANDDTNRDILASVFYWIVAQKKLAIKKINNCDRGLILVKMQTWSSPGLSEAPSIDGLIKRFATLLILSLMFSCKFAVYFQNNFS